MTDSLFSLKPIKTQKISTKYRTICTDIPVPESINLINKIYKYESRSMHGQLPIIWDTAKNFSVCDKWGNKWIDFTSTIFVSNAGHGNEKISQALTKALNKPLMHTYTYMHDERAKYLEYLIENTPENFEKAFLVSAGTEATEVAFKLMRLHGSKIGKKKNGIICFKGNWHGRTTGAQLMSGNNIQNQWIGFKDENIHHLKFPYPWEKGSDNPEQFFINDLENFIKEKKVDVSTDICGIMLETFQGWAGLFYPNEFIKAVNQFAKKNNILISFDEIQAGFGRTGKLFGYMHYEIIPDLICCGKGITSSLPLAAVLGSKEIMDLPEFGSMSSTHSANPLGCIAGLENMKEIIEKKLIENSRTMGILLHNRLNKIKERFPNHLKYVFGNGLLAGLIFLDENRNPLSSLCTKICETAMRKGLILVHTGRESIKIGPPLTISEDALEEGLDVLEDSIHENINGN